MTILLLFTTIATFGMDGVVRVASFDNKVSCEIALTEFQAVMPGARFECVENGRAS